MLALTGSQDYSTVTIPSKDTLAKFRNEKIVLLKAYDYHQFAGDLYKGQIGKLDHNFFERGLFKAIVGGCDFADSFVSSEWYYDTHIATSGLEQTAIVAGYLKSVEQLLYLIVRQAINSGKTIKVLGSGEYIDFTTENEDCIDTSLGALIGFVKHYSELWDVNKYAKYYIVDKLTEYKTKYRNDHFHKDNLYEITEIDEIRRVTLAMYYFLLGGCHIPDEMITSLKLYEKPVSIDEGLTYPIIESWLNRILGGDTLLEAGIPIYFYFQGYGGDRWMLQFNTVSGFDDRGLPQDERCPYICDELYWSRLLEKEDALISAMNYTGQDCLKRKMRKNK